VKLTPARLTVDLGIVAVGALSLVGTLYGDGVPYPGDLLFTAAWIAALLLRDHRWWVPVAVRTTAAGEALLAPAITRRLIEELVSGPPPGGTPDELTRLTDRELEVLTLVARGRSNAEIATELFIGDATVKTHVNRILSKLDLRDRVQAVVLAYECGLVRAGQH
jgi:DNA-binding CsgD family transcriptional regulator